MKSFLYITLFFCIGIFYYIYHINNINSHSYIKKPLGDTYDY